MCIWKWDRKIYNMNSFNYMNNIHNNDVNNIYEFNLIHDILNPYKRTKI